MTMLSQLGSVQFEEASKFILTNVEAEDGCHTGVTYTMENNDNDLNPDTDVQSEEESSIVVPDLKETPLPTLKECPPTPETQRFSNVIVCSSGAVENAKSFQHDIAAKSPDADVHLLACNDKGDFETLLTAYTSIDKVYILADSSICDAMLRKRMLHESISDLFEKLVETTTVYLVRRVSDKEDVKYVRLKTQLPEDVLEHKDIFISTENRAFLEQIQYQDQGENSQTPDSETNVEGDVSQQNNVVIGSNCKLTISKANHQIVAIRQDGTHNIVNVQIVPATTTSRVHVVIKTDPVNHELEQSIVHEVTEDLEVINICLSHFDGRLILITKGSIIIELDIAPGKTIGFDYLQDVLGAVFQGNIEKLIPEGTQLAVDADVQNVIPVSKLQEYYVGYAMREEDLHINCVNKDKFKDALRKLEMVTRELKDLKRKTDHGSGGLKVTIVSGDITNEKYEDAIRKLEMVTRELKDLKRKTDHGSGGLKVTIVSGDITNEKTDVVVNSTNSKLLLSDGDLSGDILKAAGTSIQRECSKQNPSPLKAGDLAVTRGGNLDCKEIYHVVLSDTYSESSLREVLKKCLRKADKSGYNSISFPALGMGKLQYDPETVVPLMYDVIMKFKPTALEEVRFVILPKFPEIHRNLVGIVSPTEGSRSRTAGIKAREGEVEDQQKGKMMRGDIPKVDETSITPDRIWNPGSGRISHEFQNRPIISRC